MTYFVCLTGDQMLNALDADDVFAVTDARGENWLCFEKPADREPDMLEMMACQQRLHALGLSKEGARCQVLLTTRDQLPRLLAA